MADLLECVIQIKALRDTLERTASCFRGAPAESACALAWARMADAERRYAAALGTAAGGDACSGDDPGGARRAFVALRRANLAALDRCTASELAGAFAWLDRLSTTVADLVAIMLAHDTDVLSALRLRPAEQQRLPPGGGLPDSDQSQRGLHPHPEQRRRRNGQPPGPDDPARDTPADG